MQAPVHSVVHAHSENLATARRRLRARRLSIMVRYQVDAVFRSAVDGTPACRSETAWVELLTDADAVKLLRIFEALRRIDLGTYGECCGCGLLIDPDRLDAEPEAHLCEVCVAFAACPATLDAH